MSHEDEPDCPGEGKCHGCMGWCDRCGDVHVTCDAPRCDAHRCHACHILITRQEWEFNREEFDGWHMVCFSCWARYTIADARERANRLQKPDEEMLEIDYIERTISRYRDEPERALARAPVTA